MSTFIEKASAYTEAGSTITISKPAGTADGHVMYAGILIYALYESINSVPSGWTEVWSVTSADGKQTLTTWRKVASSEGASYQWGFTGSTNASGGIATYSGNDNTTPVDVSGSQANDSDSTSVTAPAVITTADNETVIYIGGTRWNEPTTWTPPTSTTERIEQAGASSGGQFTSIEFAEYVQSSAGSTGTKVATINVATHSLAGQIALKEASSYAPLPTKVWSMLNG